MSRGFIVTNKRPHLPPPTFSIYCRAHVSEDDFNVQLLPLLISKTETTHHPLPMFPRKPAATHLERPCTWGQPRPEELHESYLSEAGSSLSVGSWFHDIPNLQGEASPPCLQPPLLGINLPQVEREQIQALFLVTIFLAAPYNILYHIRYNLTYRNDLMFRQKYI